jgi:hypothetical protein
VTPNSRVSIAAWRFDFTTDRFDHSATLSGRYGSNRFYGRDVAEFVSAGLNTRGMESSVFEEDFGWMVHAPLPDDGVFEVAVYHNPEDGAGTQSDWALTVRAVSKEKRFGFLPRVRERELDPKVVAKLEDVFRQSGIRLQRHEP